MVPYWTKCSMRRMSSLTDACCMYVMLARSACQRINPTLCRRCDEPPWLHWPMIGVAATNLDVRMSERRESEASESNAFVSPELKILRDEGIYGSDTTCLADHVRSVELQVAE